MPVPKISQVSIDSVSWTPIKTNRDCIYFTIRNITNVILKLRSDLNDALTEIPLQSLQEFPPGAAIKNMSPYRANEIVAYGQLSVGTANISLICV